MNAIFPASESPPLEEDVLGAVSSILWSLMLVGIVKTAIIALHFRGPAGEGGPVALYTSLYTPSQNHPTKDWMKPVIIAVTLFASALTLADGILAPSVSVVSAVGGLVVNASSLTTPDIKGIAVSILVVLFAIQPFGSGRLQHYFTPIIAIWLLFLFCIGIYNITAHPAIFRAFDPSRCVAWFLRQKDISRLSGVLLCITGVESMYVSMGRFDPTSIRLGFIAFAFPALAINYLGQGALLVVSPEVNYNNFYSTIPDSYGNSLYWVVWIVSVCAAVVASQGLITTTYSLIQHLISLKSFPPVRMVHTSHVQRHHIYIPLINFWLMVGALCVTGAFGSNLQTFGTDSSLTNAYGFCLSGTLLCTTFLLSLTMYYVKGWHWSLVIVFFVLSGFIDGLFFAGSLRKVPHGAWFTLCLSVTMAAVLCFWTWAKGLEDEFDSSHRLFLNQVFRRFMDRGRSFGDMPEKDMMPVNEEDYVAIERERGTGRPNPNSEDSPTRHGLFPPSEKDEKEGSLDEKNDEQLNGHLPSINVTPDSPTGEKADFSQVEESQFSVDLERSDITRNNNTKSSFNKPNPGRDAQRASGQLTLRTVATQDDDGLTENGILRVHSHTLDSILTRTTSQSHDGRRVKLLVDENPNRGMALEDGQGKPLKLPRVPMLAFFYHFGSGVGAPHSFTALARRTLVLPRIVVFLSLRIQAVPHVEEADRMMVNRLRGLDGFFILTIRYGYRDTVDLRDILQPCVQKIINLEKGDSSLNHGEFFNARLQTIREAAEYCTHIVPSYAPFRSKGATGIKNRLLSNIVSAIRAFLLEVVFTALSQIFPETSSWIIDESQILRVSISAEI